MERSEVIAQSATLSLSVSTCVYEIYYTHKLQYYSSNKGYVLLNYFLQLAGDVSAVATRYYVKFSLRFLYSSSFITTQYNDLQ